MKPEYLSKQIAAERLGLSVRRVLELSNAGKIRRSRVVDPKTQREQTVLLATDVARLAAATNGAGDLLAPASAADGRLARLNLALPPAELPTPRPWMTAAEAADYSGLPATFLVRLVESGKLAALDVGVRPGGRWRISRRDVDQLAGDRR